MREWPDDYPERLERDEAPTQGGSHASGRGSHRSLDGLDHGLDKAHAFWVGVLWFLAVIMCIYVVLGVLGGALYLIDKAFGG